MLNLFFNDEMQFLNIIIIHHLLELKCYKSATDQSKLILLSITINQVFVFENLKI